MGGGVNVRFSGFFSKSRKTHIMCVFRDSCEIGVWGVNVRFSGFYEIPKNAHNVRFSGFDFFDIFE